MVYLVTDGIHLGTYGVVVGDGALVDAIDHADIDAMALRRQQKRGL